QFKTCNKLAQVLARAEAAASEAEEGLLTNTDGYVVEGASSNLFWIEGDYVCTPPLVSGILAGVTRAVVEELCRELGLQFRETNVTAEDLKKMQGVFLSLSSVGIAEGISLDGERLRKSERTKELARAYWQKVAKETIT